MSNYHHNITGCLTLKDFSQAHKWLTKAKNMLDSDEYSKLITKLEKGWAFIFIKEEFQGFKVGVTNLESKKSEIISSLKRGDYKVAEKLYTSFFSYETFPEYIFFLNKYKKENTLKFFKASVKEKLTPSETELLLDMETYLEHIDKPFYRRVKSSHADFYITKTSHYPLSIHKNKDRTAIHLPWDHINARAVLSTELGSSITTASHDLGLVSLIGDFTPKGNDLTEAKYFTSTGRDYFASATGTLTDSSTTTQTKIDVDDFMKMKEVIPTAGQMKAIYGEGNYIIDGPAGTGKSTTLLQKLLILTKNDDIKGKNILVLVKHEGLVRPFQKLLNELYIQGIRIGSVSNFLNEQFGHNYEQVTPKDIDRAEGDVNDIQISIERVFDEETSEEKALACLSERLVNKRVISKSLIKYLELAHNKALFEEEIKNVETDIRSPIKVEAENKYLAVQTHESTLLKKFEYREGLKLDPKDNRKIKKLEDKRKQVVDLKNNSQQDEHELYDGILSKIQEEFSSLERSIMGQNHLKETLSLGSYIEVKIQERLAEIKDKLKKETSSLISDAFKDSRELMSLKNMLSDTLASINSSKEKFIKLLWNDGLIVGSSHQKTLMQQLSNKHLDTSSFETIIIDEAQDVPNNHIEMVGIYSKQLILAGDEAQKENSEGLGFWSNLRSKTGFKVNGELTIFKLRHNFRQTYELGRLSYNYRQLLLGQPIENLEADYFENQKGFNIPSIERISDFNKIIQSKLDYIGDQFLQRFPLVVIASDVCEQKATVIEMKSQGLTVSISQDEIDVDVIVVTVDKVAGREFPVVVTMVNKQMADNTIYILLSRAKFDLTLVVKDKRHINKYLETLLTKGMMDFGYSFSPLVNKTSETADQLEGLDTAKDQKKWNYKSQQSFNALLGDCKNKSTFLKLLSSKSYLKRDICRWQKTIFTDVLNGLDEQLGINEQDRRDTMNNMGKIVSFVKDGFSSFQMPETPVSRFRIQNFIDINENYPKGYPHGFPMMIWEIAVNTGKGRRPKLALEHFNDLPHNEGKINWNSIKSPKNTRIFTYQEKDCANRWLVLYHPAYLLEGDTPEFVKAWQSVANRMRIHNDYRKSDCSKDFDMFD